MKPFAVTADAAATVEAAPARARIRLLAAAFGLALFVLAGRAVQLAFAGDPTPELLARPAVAAIARADLVDRNGVLLAGTVRAFTLTARPDLVWNARETAASLARVFPDLDRAETARRLSDRSRTLVYLRRGLSAAERARVMDLGLAGLGFETESRRIYPNGSLAAHALGFTDRDLHPLAGVERGLDSAIRRAGAENVRLSLDVRVQYAAEAELAAAVAASQAQAGAAIVVDARTGETLALASWPSFDPNIPGTATGKAALNRAVGARYEMGSTLKAFTIAAGLDLGLVSPSERFDLTAPYEVGGTRIVDFERAPADATIRDILVHSSNKGAARIALRIGAQRQRAYLERLGLLAASPLQLAENAAPLAPRAQGQLDVATLGYGYGVAVSPAALAGAYSVFANRGARVPLTLRALEPGDPIQRTPVFSAEATAETLRDLRDTVRFGTGREADVPGLEIAGKTGTAEKLDGGAAYNSDRMFSSFAAIFPASDPRYVIVLGLDEPARTVATGGMATGGAVAARPVGRIAARIAPMLGLRVEPSGAAR